MAASHAPFRAHHANYRIIRFPDRGRGIEATCDVPQGTIVITSPCVPIAKSTIPDSLAVYVFNYGDRVALALGDASLLNHSRSANCDHHADQVNKDDRRQGQPIYRERRRANDRLRLGVLGLRRDHRAFGSARADSESLRRLLAEAYREADRLKEAAQAYAMRADDEAWYARLQEARCLRMMRDEGGFVRQALTAFDARPQRAEPLYDLARFWREHGMNTASLLFSEAGLVVPRPDQDAPFVEDFVYLAGSKRSSRSPPIMRRSRRAMRASGNCATSWPWPAQCPKAPRNRARSNLRFYAPPARTLMPSVAAHPVGFSGTPRAIVWRDLRSRFWVGGSSCSSQP